MLIVLDTNVLVSALLKRESNPAAILNAILENHIELAVDQRIFEEYREFLHRPKLNIRADVADSTLRFIAFSALWVQTHPVEFPQDLINDFGDLPFAEVAVCSSAEALVTGNVKHFTFMSGFNSKVLTQQEFLAEYRK
jgi:putative PIN family toxin of toxin-antitoxin system